MHLIKQMGVILETQCVQDVATRPKLAIVVLVDLGMRAKSLWERACSRWPYRVLPDRPHRLHREQARSHNGCN
ncbi:hypothetical protein EU514_03205 [Pseudomonas fragi]|nr:hypothetical protein [Pseudomonas fragi]